MLTKSYAQDHWRACQTAFTYFIRTPSTTLITLIAIGVCLALPMSLYLFIKNIQHFSRGWDQHSSMTIYVDAKSSLAQVNHLMIAVKKYPFVKKATYISAESGLKEFERTSQMQDVLSLLKDNPLPGAITLELDPKATSAHELDIMKQRLSRFPKVISVSFDYNWVEKLQALLTLGKALTKFLYALIGLGVVLVVSNTVRLALERHQDEIEVMTLVGATRAFIRRPFLYRGVILGALSGTIALLILIFATALLRHPAEAFASLYQSLFQLEGLSLKRALFFLFTSAALGWLGAGLAFTQQQRALASKNEYTSRRLS